MSSIFRITDPILSDDSIEKNEYFGYDPVTGTPLNNSGGDITICIETQYIFYIPAKAFYL